jgi:hypothetical protein
MNEYTKKYKLSKEQIEIYEWVKNQNINTDDNTICYWVKTYDPKRIKEVINFAKERAKSGQEIRNLGGWIQKFLKTGQAVVDDNCKTNLAFVEQFKLRTNWQDLKVYEKYVKDTVTTDDLSLTMESEEFRRALESLYQKSQLYK